MKTGEKESNPVSDPIPTGTQQEAFKAATADSTNTPYVIESPLVTILYMLRYVVPVAYIVLLPLWLAIAAKVLSGELVETLSSGIVVLIIVLYIGNIVLSFLTVENVHPLYCVRTMLIVRYGVIPFFIFNTIITSFIILAGMFASLFFVRFAIIYWVSSSFILMLPGAFYGIRVIRLSLREEKISRTAAILHGIAQFIPVAGVLDSAYLSVFKWKTGGKISFAVLLVSILAVALFLILNPEAIPFLKAIPSYVKILFEEGVFGR